MSIAGKMGCTAQTLNEWVKKAEVDSGRKAGLTTDMAAKLKALERDNRGLRPANEILRKASAYFAQAELDRRHRSRSASSTITAGPMGSSRSARGCRSLLPPAMSKSPSGSIRGSCRLGQSETWR
ncbi:hypothetical protein GCM10019059_41860 [Camelimonas fluminis]|nr:hypothetical protein GCM10019059_41860 [Camelimonas fluminis]